MSAEKGRNGASDERGGKSRVNSDVASENSIINSRDLKSDLYADGKWRAWSTVFGAWLIQLCAVGVVSSFGVFQEVYTTSGSLMDTTAISWIGSMQICLEYSIAPLGGELLDRGYFRSIVTIGCTLFVFSFFMLSLVAQDKYYQILLAQGVGMGFGVGLLFLPTSVVAIKHFKRQQAFVMGIVDSSIALGGVTFSIVLNYLLHHQIGFAWGVRIAAFIVLGCFAVGLSLISMPKQKSLADGDGKPTQALPAKWKEVFVDAKDDWPYILALSQGFVMSLGTFVPSFYIQLFAEMHGTAKETAFYALAVLSLSGLVGRVLPNYLGDKFGVLNMYIPCLTMTGILCFAMLGASNAAGLFSFAIFYGFFFGATNGMYLPLINSLSTGSADHLWKRCGISLLPPAVAALIGPPIAGRILTAQFVWWRGITFASLTMLAAVSLVVTSKILIMRRKPVAAADEDLR